MHTRKTASAALEQMADWLTFRMTTIIQRSNPMPNATRPKRPPVKYTDAVLFALAAQYQDRTAFRVSQPSAYQTAVVRGLLASITTHMPKRRRIELVTIDPAILTATAGGSS